MRSPPPFLALAIAATACNGGGPRAAEATAAPRPVQVGEEGLAVATVREIATGPRISGSLEPRHAAAVRAEVGGDVLEVEAELGERVEKGQVLARLESRTLRNQAASARAAVAAARAELEVATREVARTERLVGAGALAERELEQTRAAAAAARARLGEARAGLASAEEALDGATARSPMDGVVSRREVNAGDVIAPGALLFEVIEPSSMRLEASVPSERLAALAVGTPVEFTVRGYPEQTFSGRIERIAPAADPVTRQIPILVDLPNPGGRLVAGLFAEGAVSAERREGIVVPLDAVDEERLEPTVLRVRGGVAEEVPVRVGLRDERGERVEILSGLAPGDLLLVGPARATAPGTPVALPEGFAAPAGPAANGASGGAAGSGGAPGDRATPAGP